MNWARGLRLAAIHVAIAIPLIASEEIPRVQTEKIHSQVHKNSIVLAAYQEVGGTVLFSPCGMWRHISWQEKVLIASELPAMILSEWNEPCPDKWTLAGVLGINPGHHSIGQRVASDFGVLGLIAIQWIVLGGFPLVRPRRWWLEPGAGNTALTCIAVVCMLVGAGITSIPSSQSEILASPFGLVGILALLLTLWTWLVWFCLIAGRLCRFGWQAVAASWRRARNR